MEGNNIRMKWTNVKNCRLVLVKKLVPSTIPSAFAPPSRFVAKQLKALLWKKEDRPYSAWCKLNLALHTVRSPLRYFMEDISGKKKADVSWMVPAMNHVKCGRLQHEQLLREFAWKLWYLHLPPMEETTWEGDCRPCIILVCVQHHLQLVDYSSS